MTVDESNGPESDPDGAVLAAVARGDADALRVLADRHGRSLLSYLTGLTPDSRVAEETLQDTLVAVWKGAGGFVGGSSVRTWMFGIARRRAIQTHRRVALDIREGDGALERTTDPSPGPEAVVLARAQVDRVATAINALRPLHREILLLACVQEMTGSEVAAVLGIPIGTVKSRLSNARTALMTALLHDEKSGGNGGE